MKVFIYPADLHGCGFFRLIWPARALAAMGHDVTIMYPANHGLTDSFGRPEYTANLRGVLNADGDTINVSAPKDADVMVMQRITNKHLAQAVPIWRKAGIAVVIDVDDDLSTIHPSNPAFTALHPRGGKEKFGWQYALAACEAATLVTVSTPALIDRYASHGRGAVIPNCVPQSYLDIDHEDSDVIGWGGSVATHPDDLHTTGPAISQVLADTGGSFTIVGPPGGLEKALRLQGQQWKATGGVPLAQWPHALAANIGIGIAPLADTVFNQAKSCLKPLEYSALGIPVVMSPRADYVRLHKQGVGLLADKPKEWARLLRGLVQHKDMRLGLAEQGREVAARWTIEGNAQRWWNAWELARAMQVGDVAQVHSNSSRTLNTPHIAVPAQ